MAYGKSLILLAFILLKSNKSNRVLCSFSLIEYSQDKQTSTRVIAKDLLKKLNDRKGPVYVEIDNFNDGYWIQVVKQDLIANIKKFKLDEETGFELDVNGYFSKDFQS